MLRSIPHTLRAGTPDLPDLPPFVPAILAMFLSPILSWFSAQVYRAVLFRCASHPLVRLAQVYDFAPVVVACQTYHHPPGAKGATPTYPVEQLVRAEFVRAWAESASALVARSALPGAWALDEVRQHRSDGGMTVGPWRAAGAFCQEGVRGTSAAQGAGWGSLVRDPGRCASQRSADFTS